MFPVRFIRVIAVLVAMVGFTLSLGGNQASAQAFGICHATGSQTNQYELIEPDDQSFAAHLEHIGPGGGDRFATAAEAEEGDCFNDEEPTATTVPPTATNVPPTDVPGQPTATTAPDQPEPTDVPVQTLPETGANPSDGNQSGLLLIAGSIAVLLFSGATWAATRTRR
jgi:hypothetical protein